MADREIIRPPFKADFPNITDAGFRYLQQLAAEVNLIRGGTTHGTGTDYTQIEKDGTIRLFGAATTWKDLDLDLLSLAHGAAAPGTGTLAGGIIEYLMFDGAGTTEAVNGYKELQHDIVMNVIKPHIHWFPTDASAGNVKWNLTYTITNVGDAEPAETTISVTTTAPGAIQAAVSGFPDIDVSSFTKGAQFSFRIWRNPTDVADTYGADVATKTFGLHVEIESMGTREVIID